ncbi:MAG: C2H2-type zinc finger protein [Candidatus Paceibacterota bacterium]|jgi:hypothetical protein
MYDLMKPHKRVVQQGKPTLILQDGLAYLFGSGECVGKIDLQADFLLSGRKDYFLCKVCGGTFPRKERLEEHMLSQHRDILLAAVSARAPKVSEGTWSPSDEMLKKEASKVADSSTPASGEAASEAPAPVEEPSEDSPKKKPWRKPVK